jgi:hypothetical protein
MNAAAKSYVRHLDDGTEIHINEQSGFIGWAADWEKVFTSSQVIGHHRGPSCYGHVDYFFLPAVDEARARRNGDLQ